LHCWYYSHCNRLYEHSPLHSRISDCPTHMASLHRANWILTCKRPNKVSRVFNLDYRSRPDL